MEFLLEIGTEEIPAGFLKRAFKDITDRFTIEIEKNWLFSDREKLSVVTTGTPRRLTVYVSNLIEKQPDLKEESIGPAKSIAYDENGKPTKVAISFAFKKAVDLNKNIQIVKTDKGEFLKAIKEIPGRPTIEVLAEILPRLIKSIPWRKSMRWGDGDLRFARPIHWIVALLDGKVVPFELGGIKSGDKTYGHRFAAPGEIKVSGYDDYKKKLNDAFVMVDYEERLKLVKKGINERAEELGGKTACFPELFDEITNLVEYPKIIDATFPEHFLEVPDIAIIASMTGHQRYVPLRGLNGGALLNKFITVANTPVKDPKVVAQGNERVLNARLSDAKFFYETDKKKPLEEFAQKLTDVLYIKGMGSYADKSARIEKLAGKIAEWIDPDNPQTAEYARRAAKLAKADLVTLMVGEFPSLQGQMGGIYALKSGEPLEVSDAIKEHYLPKNEEDIRRNNLPEFKDACAVAIADRADSLAACFALGLTPKGDQDPYALRRAVLGILAIIKEKQLKLSISELIKAAVEGVISNSQKTAKELVDEITYFIRERIRQQLMLAPIISVRTGAVPFDATGRPLLNMLPDPPPLSGAAPDTVEAVLRTGIDDYLDLVEKVNALTEFRTRPDFEDLATSFRRIGNILESFHSDKVDESLFSEPSEKELWKAFNENKDRVGKLAESGKYLEALNAMAEIRPAVDKFFDEVLVNDAKNPKLRDNRHSLLYAIHKSFLAVADFSAIARQGA